MEIVLFMHWSLDNSTIQASLSLAELCSPISHFAFSPVNDIGIDTHEDQACVVLFSIF